LIDARGPHLQGHARQDESDVLLRQLGTGLGAVVATAAVAFQIAKRTTVKPREVFDWVAFTSASLAERHGFTFVVVTVTAAIVYFVGGWALRAAAAKRAAENAQRDSDMAAAAKAERKRRRADAARERAALRDAQSVARSKAIEEEEALLAKMKTDQTLNAAESRERAERLWREAALWTDAEQEALDAAVAALDEWISPESKWDKIASRVNGRTAEECLVRTRYQRHQAMLAAEASAEFDNPEDEEVRSHTTRHSAVQCCCFLLLDTHAMQCVLVASETPNQPYFLVFYHRWGVAV
jgi:flagellar biosynthesis GTPase FlhF